MVWFPVYTKGRPFDSEGGGWEILSGEIVSSMNELGQNIYFQVFQCQNTYFHPPQNFEKGRGG